MSVSNIIAAEIREDVGKGASRRLRRTGKIPAVIYGGDKDPVALTLEHREVLHAAETESFFSSIMEIKVADGRQQQVVVRDLQRHPYRQQILHLDFMRVSATEKLRMSLPLHFLGEDESPAGTATGVVIQHLVNELEVEALPKDLPEFIEVDLSNLEPGEAVMLSGIKLPAGVSLMGHDEDEDEMIANAIHISEDQGTGAAAAAEAEALAAEEGEQAEAVEGEEGEAEGAQDEAAEGEADEEESDQD